ncbi:8-amino-7-oxononanoate synthase [Veillonella sp. oral taxon 780]|uniref:8-amino-7-oxononanoate synthase n=1 Tax=Veillonella sp. oral taxon 780 TaxID=671229 RepID=UPI00021A39D9|nr:8-amino-7-oxononanoate synthase [Veillonella sp. oral taxon 780]EGS38390.1 8-amino-7-oxononanoate synthase [Veillonella sp. oral taxon 780 str. F0422]
MFNRYSEALVKRQEESQFRSPRTYTPIDATHVMYEGSTYLMMASNNYLGLTHHPHVKDRALQAIQQYGTGSGGARLTSGSFPLFQELETRLAQWKDCEKALTFTAGFMANLGTISALVHKGDIIFSDELNHASLIDGCRLSGAKVQVYPHKDLAGLESSLSQSKHYGMRFIITDGVFSMDGDIAPLPELLELAERYDALLIVDDAHATGVIGEGRGTAHHFHCENPRIIITGTMSKALGSIGGYVCGSQTIIDYIINHSRPFIFATALSPADIGASIGALEVLAENPSVYQKLRSNTEYMHNALQSLGIPSSDDTPIFPIIIGSNEDTVEASRLCEREGIILSGIRPPTVPVNTGRLRLTVTAAHTEEELQRVIQVLHTLPIQKNL